MYKFKVITSHIASELVASIMFDLDGQGVCIQDPLDFDEIDKYGVVWDYKTKYSTDGKVFVEGFFEREDRENVEKSLKEALQFLKDNSDFDVGPLEVIFEEVANNDWITEWKKYYNPIILESIAVYPSWIQPLEGLPVVKIEPGSAFGTGEHESTRMCLELIQKLPLKGKEIADVGCGSGILGIAGLILGARSCYYSDLDPNAVNNLKINIELNNVQSRSIYEVASLLENTEKQFDYIFANITVDILTLLAPAVRPHLKENGEIIISGIISDRGEEIVDVFERLGFKIIDKLSLGEWQAYRLS